MLYLPLPIVQSHLLRTDPKAGQGLAITSWTPRELEVLHWISQGLDCRAIARCLSISELTVRKHRSNILRKAGLCHCVQLTALAVNLDFR
ncbi:response regulator transcription factor [Pseudomonas sp. RA_105y_Pfl1_P41]|uniref:response regulator transcription factor n=1 Tax=unclassified Pseudomonas TaxID=196821 RepID=UPI00403F5E6F